MPVFCSTENTASSSPSLHVLDHEVDDETLRQGQAIAHLDDDDVFHLGLVDDFGQDMGEILQEDGSAGTRILELMRKLPISTAGVTGHTHVPLTIALVPASPA